MPKSDWAGLCSITKRELTDVFGYGAPLALRHLAEIREKVQRRSMIEEEAGEFLSRRAAELAGDRVLIHDGHGDSNVHLIATADMLVDFVEYCFRKPDNTET